MTCTYTVKQCLYKMYIKVNYFRYVMRLKMSVNSYENHTYQIQKWRIGSYKNWAREYWEDGKNLLNILALPKVANRLG